MKALKAVDKNLRKATTTSGFNINCHVTGGVSKSKDHSLYSTSVDVTYDADVYRTLMKVATPEAYRLPGQKGAAKNAEQNIWQGLHGNRDAKMMTRLMGYPHEVLRSALKDADKVEWIWVGDEFVEAEEDEIEVDEEGEKGTTGVAKRNAKEETGPRGTPHLVRVTLQQKIAQQFFTEAKNSGCVSGG